MIISYRKQTHVIVNKVQTVNAALYACPLRSNVLLQNILNVVLLGPNNKHAGVPSRTTNLPSSSPILIAIIMLPFQLSRLYSRHVFRRLFSTTQDSFSKSNRGHRCQSCLLLDSTKNSLSYRNIATGTTSHVFQKSTKPEVKDQPTYMM